MKYHVARDGQQIGIFLEYEVREGLQRGELRGTDLYWREGMAEWVPLSSSEDLVDSLNSYVAPAEEGGPSPLSAGNEPLVLATLSQRFRAFLVDALPVSFCYYLAETGAKMIDPKGVPNAEGATLLVVGCLISLTLLIINVTMLCTRGQSIGKRLMNIRIVNFDDGARPGFVAVILLRGIVGGIIGMVPYVGLAYSSADVACIFREDRRCLHDWLAGTQVVQGQPPQS